MIYTKQVKKAMRTAYKAHEGQVDIAGMPYIFHPIHLAEQMDTEDSICLALLHDIVEDTDLTIKELRKRGFKEEVLIALELITKKPDEEYFSYIKKVKESPLATQVKIADLKHNMDVSRLKKPSKYSEKRIKKYKKALSLLK